MDKINVMVISKISEGCKRQIKAVSPKINLLDATTIWDSPDIVTTDKKGDLKGNQQFDAMLTQANVLYGYIPPGNVVARAPGLKWMQCMVAGADNILTDDIVKSDVILTNTSGIHVAQVSEVALEFMLMLAKRAPLYFKLQQEKQWKSREPAMTLHSKTVGIVGLGNIGRGVAKRAKAFGMRVIATRRTAKQGARARYVDKMVTREHLSELLAESDFVVLILPKTPETHKYIGEKELRTMKKTAYLINVGRGYTLDEDALVRALEEHWIAGAGLDAFATEPLPTDSKLWTAPNLVISPHIGGMHESYDVLATELFCDNLKRYLGGKKLRNVVDRKLGY